MRHILEKVPGLAGPGLERVKLGLAIQEAAILVQIIQKSRIPSRTPAHLRNLLSTVVFQEIWQPWRSTIREWLRGDWIRGRDRVWDEIAR
ncbi:hypothetical protein [Acidicapsa ligni]|uniref:hypothetical protein n=1 Tax=Acidicapsa ligni TaxID=542300 RepID=UPI0021DF7B15|nr:hypothetical protein [Acidicapsa ligni]